MYIFLKKLFSIIIFFSMVSALFAQTWDKEMTKKFRQAKQISINIDLSNAIVCDLPYPEFLEYYAINQNKDLNYSNLLFLRFRRKFISELCDCIGKKSVAPDAYVFNINYIFKEITSKAGLLIECYIDFDGIESAHYTCFCNEGRWNTFDNLLMESTEMLFRGGKRAVGNPLQVKWHYFGSQLHSTSTTNFRRDADILNNEDE